jgi:hypothetical protein
MSKQSPEPPGDAIAHQRTETNTVSNKQSSGEVETLSPEQQSERNLSAAITKLIDQQYGDGGSGFFARSRDMVAVSNTQVRISYEVCDSLLSEFYGSHKVFTFGTFDNCREYGLTIDGGGGWTFCVYEHRNSDRIHIQGCPNDEIRPYGPYGNAGDADKFDTLAWFSPGEYFDTATALASMIRRVNNDPRTTREQLKGLVKS